MSKGEEEESKWSPTSAAASQLLALPDAGDASSTVDPAKTVSTVVVGGNAVKLDHLGPMIVNHDGTISRISNWHRLSEHEQEVALRRIGKRNRERLMALQAAAEGQGQGSTDQGASNPSAVKLHGAGDLLVGVPSPHSLAVAAEAAGDTSNTTAKTPATGGELRDEEE